MLQLILGRSGSGKSHRIYGDIASRAAAGETGLILLVPEQFSFEAERTLLRRLGARGAAAVQVLSFTRLAQAVAKEQGGLSRRVMDEVTRSLLMSRALAETADQLTLYRRHAGRADYVGAVLAAQTECKRYAVTPPMLEKAASALPEGTLRQKLRELSLIMTAYEALAADSYLDPEDQLTRLAEQLPGSALGKGARIYLDGFKGFTSQELAVVEQLMRRSRETVAALCTDTLDPGDEYALFATVTRTAARLISMAREAGIDVAVERLTGNRRTRSPALQAVERYCFTRGEPVMEDPTDGVTLMAAPDRYGECRYLARELRRLMREEGIRARDIAVTARNPEDYRGILDAALQEAGIPFYMDQREGVETEPLPALLTGALRCVTGGFRSEQLLQIMKTGLLGFSPRSVGLLENYTYTWRLSGSRMRQEWTAHPEGLAQKPDENSVRRLAYLNLLRRRLIDPLEKLAEDLTGEITGLAFATALYAYLTRARVPRLVRFRYRQLTAAGEEAAAERLARLWDMTMELLDRFGSALRTTRMTAPRFGELLELGTSVLDMGSIPQGLDAVQVGAAHRMRFSSPRVVWILGANEGVFPAYPSGGGLLTDRDRLALQQVGVQLADTCELQGVEERLYAYFALSAPSEKLYISYLAGAGEEALPPSELVRTVEDILPGAARWEPGMPESAADAFRALGEGIGSPTPATGALERYFAGQEEYKDRLAAMGRARLAAPFAFADPRNAAAFFGRHMWLSASQVDKFYSCRFSYFCRYGLQVYPRQRADMGRLEAGILTHYVLQTVLPHYGEVGYAAVTREQVTADAKAAVEAYLEEYMGGTADKSRRFMATVGRLVRTVDTLLWRIVKELVQSRFVPVDYELDIGREGVLSDPITLPGGATVQVLGKIDRVDAYRRDDRIYLRVIDYKTGSKQFQLDQVVQGLDLQMLMYAFTLWDNGSARYGARPMPAGVLYMPIRLTALSGSREDTAAIEKERNKQLRMSGLVLDDPDIVTAMEADGAGLLIPASIKKGAVSGASVATLARFGALKQRVEQLLRQMGEALQKGDVAALPAKRGKDLLGCEHCDFRAVCGREEEDPGREIRSMKPAEVWKELEEEPDPHLDGKPDM